MTSESGRLPWQGEQSGKIEYNEREKSQGTIYLIFGPEGSGKSTQAKLLSVSTGIPYIAFGDTFREVAAEKSQLGKECKRLVESRSFANYETYQEVFRHKFTKKPNVHDTFESGMILDGAVRTDEQIGAFLALLKSTNRIMPIHSVYYRTPVWLSFKRQEDRQRNDSSSKENILRALTNHYDELGKRMTKVREISTLSIIPVLENEAPKRVHEKTLIELGINN